MWGVIEVAQLKDLPFFADEKLSNVFFIDLLVGSLQDVK